MDNWESHKTNADNELDAWRSWTKRFAESVQAYKAAIDILEELRVRYRDEELLLAFYEPSAEYLVKGLLSRMLNDSEYVLRHLK